MVPVHPWNDLEFLYTQGGFHFHVSVSESEYHYAMEHYLLT